MTNYTSRCSLLSADALKGRRLGISVSESPDLDRLGLFDGHFRMTLGEVARTVIVAGGSLYYGGHLQPGGITAFLINELHRYGRRDRPFKICLAWTEHRSLSSEQIDEQKIILGLYGEIFLLSPDGQVIQNPDDVPLEDTYSSEFHSAALTGLRSYLTQNTDARIVVGGKRSGFQGRIPGIVEEVLLSLEHRQPLYLAGGFGGATLDVIRTLRPEFAEWFPALPVCPEPDRRLADGLEKVAALSRSQNWDGFENGLDENENRLLAATYRSSEIATLVGRGLGRIM